jgi:hypothetical protein
MPLPQKPIREPERQKANKYYKVIYAFYRQLMPDAQNNYICPSFKCLIK